MVCNVELNVYVSTTAVGRLLKCIVSNKSLKEWTSTDRQQTIIL